MRAGPGKRGKPEMLKGEPDPGEEKMRVSHRLRSALSFSSSPGAPDARELAEASGGVGPNVTGGSV